MHNGSAYILKNDYDDSGDDMDEKIALCVYKMIAHPF